ncbi:MAG: NUDIX domain-containing protein [Candidatus ainarchaeum sp.]|nr:NUDIX domain-containing protein [Candidatus ainarchaeum sp.]
MSDHSHPEPTVGILILNPKGKVFLVRSHKWDNLFTVPGGHIELGEKAEDAVKREAKEETNLDVYDIQFLMQTEGIFDSTYYKKKHFIFLIHSCKTNSKEVKLNKESEEYTWATIPEAFRLPLTSYTKKIIEEYKKKLEEKKN